MPNEYDLDAEYELETEYGFDCSFEVNAVLTEWGSINGDINEQTDLINLLDTKADANVIEGLDTRITNIEDTISGYGNIVTHDVSEFATAQQGALADTSLQPNDNITLLNNNAGYVKAEDVPSSLADLGTETQMQAINSGITASGVSQITTNKNDIITINGKIPSDATTTNQLADKNFVNSSISTNTANFIGTFNSLAELEAYSGTVTNNDYAFVIGTDSAGNTVYNRYKYSDATIPPSWLFEYALNNSSFTSTQWQAINSGANTTNIGQIATNTNAISDINTTISGYGNIVTHDVGEFASSIQGALADTSLQPNDDISLLNNNVGFTTNVGTVTSVNNTLPDANGDVSLFIPPAQVQSDWDENDTISASYIKNKPYIPVGVVVDQNYDATSQNAQSGTAVAEAIATVDISDDVKHALKGYNDDGQLLTDTILYDYVRKLVHSTFDLSKFTVVGTPTITDEGIASGFSGSDYLTKTLSESITLDKVNFKGKFYSGSGTLTQNIIFSLSNSPSSLPDTVFQLSYIQSSKIIGLSGHNDTTWTGWYSPSNTISLDTWYYYHAYYDNGKIKLDISLDGNNFINVINQSITVNSSYSSNKLFIGSLNNGANYCEGSIDLKQFSITVDGVEVFSGNKTGTDTYYTNNYTVEGNPTITDGVMSNIHWNTTQGGYVTTEGILNQNLGDYDTWSIEIPCTLRSTIGPNSYDILLYDGTTSDSDRYLGIQLRANYKTLRIFLFAEDNTWIANAVNTTDTYNDGDSLTVKLEFTGTQYIFSTKKSGENWKTQITVNSSKKLKKSNNPLKFGVDYRYNEDWYGTIDLWGIKFFGNGRLIYTPKLFVPYHATDNGLLIADDGYRCYAVLVGDTYGSSPYFTIDTTNENTTLPMPDIYSLLGNKIPDYSSSAITIATTPYTVGVGGHYLLFESAVDSATVSINGLQVASVSGTGTFAGSIYSIRMGDVITYTGSPVLKILGERSA